MALLNCRHGKAAWGFKVPRVPDIFYKIMDLQCYEIDVAVNLLPSLWRYPLAVFQAFRICLASTDSRLCCLDFSVADFFQLSLGTHINSHHKLAYFLWFSFLIQTTKNITQTLPPTLSPHSKGEWMNPNTPTEGVKEGPFQLVFHLNTN